MEDIFLPKEDRHEESIEEEFAGEDSDVDRGRSDLVPD
jgi:hypothetical protein